MKDDYKKMIDQQNESLQEKETLVEQNPLREETVDAVGASALKTAVGTGILIKKSHLWIGVAVTVALILCGFFFGRFYGKSSDNLQIDPGARDYGEIQAIPENQNPDGISVPMFSKVIFPAEEKEVQIVLLNPKGNSCYFRYTLRIGAEEIFQSGLIPPGMAVTDLTLSHGLAEGEYEMEIIVETFSLDREQTPMNGATQRAVLYVR